MAPKDIFGTTKWEELDKRVLDSKKRMEWDEDAREFYGKRCLDHVELSSLELLSLPVSGQVMECQRKVTSEEDIETWLNEGSLARREKRGTEPDHYAASPALQCPAEDGSSSTGPSLRPAKLRLLYGYLTERTSSQIRFPFPLASLQQLATTFQHSKEHVNGFQEFPNLTLRQWSVKIRHHHRNGIETDGEDYTAFYLRVPVYGHDEDVFNLGFFVLSVIYNPATNVTQAFLLCARRMQCLNQFVHFLIRSSPELSASEPGFVATRLAKIALDEHREALQDAAHSISTLTQQLGYGKGFGPDPGANDTTGEEPMGMDFMLLTKNLQRALNILSYTQEAVDQQLLMLKMFEDIDSRPAKAGDMPKMEDMKQVLTEFRWENEVLLFVCKKNFVLADSLSALIYNLLTLQEARVQRSLAESSRTIAEASLRDSSTMKIIAEATLRDSSAMKSIAVLTMVFLPATAVAGILDTPFFSWNDDNKLVTRDFGLFWAVTIPITIGVLLVWVLVARPEQAWTRRVRVSWRARVAPDAPTHTDGDDCLCNACKPNAEEGKKASRFGSPLRWRRNHTAKVHGYDTGATQADIELGDISHVASTSKTSLQVVDGPRHTETGSARPPAQ